jgi:PKD repeat protein
MNFVKRWLLIALVATGSVAVPAAANAAGSHNPAEHGSLLGPLLPRTARQAAPSSGGNLLFHGGPVMHKNTVYAIYWTGNDDLIPSDYSDGIDQYFRDVATDSGRNQNVYSTDSQYGDGTGFAAYDSSFGGGFRDFTPLPTAGCNSTAADFCVSDEQIRNELDTFITSSGLPRGLSTIYFVFLPEGYGTCYNNSNCAYTQFCAYHSHFGSGSGTTLYANQPWDDFVPNDSGSSVCGSQPSPNGEPALDHELSTVSHEHNEAITDPLGNAWFDADGNENGDKCAYVYGPSLGVSEFDDYNQAIDSGRYELQLEWSNASESCLARTGGANQPPNASFTAPPSPAVNVAGTFDGSSSSDPDGQIASYSWDFGDGGTATGASPSHAYTTSGNKTVKLTVTDNGGSKDTTIATIHVLGVGCEGHELAANDDGYTGEVPLPFTLNLFGQVHSSLFVNNNGDVTFDGPLATYTPFDLTSTATEIIAPFFGDVDTRGAGSDLVTYGATTYAGQPAFCVNWGNSNGVGYFEGHNDKLNKFHLMLVDRSDIQPGDFDVIASYDQIQWETGDASSGIGGIGGFSARVGYSNGTREPATFFELPGSAVNGSFLDSNFDTGLIHNSRGSLTPGRYVYEVRNGAAPVGGSIHGAVKRPNDELVAHAPVQACPQGGGSCVTSQTNDSGTYTIAGLDAGAWTITANPPAGDATSLPGSTAASLAVDEHKTGVDVVLGGAAAPPHDTTITSIGTWADGEPVLFWQEPLRLTTEGCAGGSAHYSVTIDGNEIRAGEMTEEAGHPGHYAAQIAPLYPNHGYAQFHLTVTCPNPAQNESDSWSAYIDPSGVVTTTAGDPVSGATVSLYRSDAATGPFDLVPDGDGAMSPQNRHNPDSTSDSGSFGWDVVAGYYLVRAEKPGCHAPGNPARPDVETGVLTIPPAVTDLHLSLACPTLATVSPGSLGFAARASGTRSPAQGVTVANSGDAPLHVTSVSLAGPQAGDFRIDSNGCTGNVEPGGACGVAVSFAPSAVGTRTATLILHDNTDAGTHTVALSGVGEPAGGAPSPGPGPQARPGAGQCAGLHGQKLAACERAAALAKSLARCSRKHGKARAECRRRATALAKCSALKGKARRKCQARATAPGGTRRRGAA